jgi:hypothetical protein
MKHNRKESHGCVKYTEVERSGASEMTRTSDPYHVKVENTPINYNPELL